MLRQSLLNQNNRLLAMNAGLLVVKLLLLAGLPSVATTSFGPPIDHTDIPRGT